MNPVCGCVLFASCLLQNLELCLWVMKNLEFAVVTSSSVSASVVSMSPDSDKMLSEGSYERL